MTKYYGYIYKITCLINDRCYVGQKRKDTFDESYWGSSKNKEYWNDLKQYGKENFKREILCWAKTQKELNDFETEAIIKEKALCNFGGYNLWLNRQQAEWNNETKEKHHKNLLVAMSKPEYREKLSMASKGKHLSEETKKKLSNSIKNSEKRKQIMASETYRKNMSNSIKNSEKHKRWYTDPILKAKKWNAETRAKISKAVSNSNIGKHWWTNEKENRFCKECPGEDFKPGRSKIVKNHISKGRLKVDKNAH